MRLLCALLVGAALVAGPTATAEPSGDCGGLPAAANPVDPREDGFYVRVCVAGVGSATLANGGNEYGYFVIDGDSSNAGIAPCLDGYAGLESSTTPGDQNVVAEADGDYSPPRKGASGENPDPTSCIPG